MSRVEVLSMILLLTILSAFIAPGHGGSPFAYFTLQPGDTTVPLNPMNNVTFNCTCSICINRPLFWTLTNNGVSLATNDNADQAILDQRGITYNSDINTAVLIIPSTTENNDTQIACKGIQNPANIIETSNPVMLTIIDASLDLPADPMLRIISSSQVEIRWEIPNSHELFRLQGYNIEIVNGSSGDVLQILQDYNETSYVYTFEDDVQYCQILTVNVTAVADLGSSVPRSISRGFPIALQPLESEDINIAVTFPDDKTRGPMVNISFKAPQICDYQTANYTLRIEDVTDSEMPPLTREGSYTGSNNSVTEVFTSGLKIDSNYTVFLSAAENQSGTEVSIFVNFTTLFRPTGTSSDSRLGITVGVTVAVLLFLLVSAIVISAVVVNLVVRKKK